MTTAGEKLRTARLKKGLTLDDVSIYTKIKPAFLEYIENGQYQKLPSVSYAHGFVRNYALFLGLNEKDIIAIFKREFDEDKNVKVLPKSFDVDRQYNRSRFKIRSAGLLIVTVFVLFFGFIIIQYRSAFLSPTLIIISPQNDSLINSSQITIQGKTDPDATVYVDKNEVSVDGSGNFSKTVNVFPGQTTIIIRSINRFQKETAKKMVINIKGS